MDITRYKNNYINIVNVYKKNGVLPKHKIFEYLWALKNEMILWEDIPPGFDEIYDLPHVMDYGIDLISLGYDKCGQVKYHNSSKITWNMMTNFISYSDMLSIDDMHLCTTNVAEIDKMALKYLNKKNVTITRDLFENMLEDIPHCEVIDEIETTEIEQRDYLVDCSKMFRQGDKKVYKFQLPCGLGKSYIIFDIVKKSVGRHVVFVPWIDLANQFERDANKFGIKTSFLGNGKCDLDIDCDLLICINKSYSKIPLDWKFDYKFIDEAHHLENDDSVLRNKINEISCEKTLMLSATYKYEDDVDYEMNLRDGIDKGYLSDYVINIEYFTNKNRYNGLIDVVKNNLNWSPMFVYFNNVKTAKKFAKDLREFNVVTDYLDGTSCNTKRKKVKQMVESNNLQVLSLCGCYNEGISIDNLQTVIFGDLRFSDINRIQVSMRASRVHHSKPYFRIVLPVVEKNFDDNDISDLVKTFFKLDPKIKTSIKNKTQSRVRITVDSDNLKKSEEEYEEEMETDEISEKQKQIENACLIREEVYDSMGKMIQGLSPEEKVDEFIKYVEEFNGMPDRDTKFSDGCNMRLWMYNSKTKFRFEEKPYSKALKNKRIREDHEKYLVSTHKNRDIIKLKAEQRVSEFLKYVVELNEIPNKGIMFSNGYDMNNWYIDIRSKFGLDKKPHDALLANDIIRKNYEDYVKSRKNDSIIKHTPEQKVSEFIKYVENTNYIPKPDEQIFFLNKSKMGNWFFNCKFRSYINKKPYDELLKNDLLKKNYEDYKKQDKFHLSDSEKVDELLKHVMENNELPKKGEVFSNGSSIGSFMCSWKSKHSQEPYSKLLENDLLKKFHDKYLKINEKNKKTVKLTIKQKINEILTYVNTHNKIFSKTHTFSNNRTMYGFFGMCKRKGWLNKEPYSTLMENKILKEKYNNYIKSNEKNKNIVKILQEQKIDELLMYVTKNSKIPTRKIKYSNGQSFGRFWGLCKREFKLNDGIYVKLLENSLLKNDYDNYLKIKDKKKKNC